MSIRTWAIFRRLQYATGFFLVVGAFVVLLFFTVLYVPANCFDLTKNGEERGVDCGGGCVQICAADLLPPKVVWVESFEIVEGQYNAVAYIENANQTAGAPALTYTFQLFNNGEKVGERIGKASLPPNSVQTIFEGRVLTDNDQPVTDTNIILEVSDLWLPASVERDQFRAIDMDLTSADTKPRLDVEIQNNTLERAQNIEFVATIFNENGKPITASQSFIEKIEQSSTQNIVFTWPQPIAKIVRNCVIPTDVAIAIDLSGSMNNDGDNPPQPVTKALEAAGKFINSLRKKDQIAVVTFATEAMVVNPLTDLHASVAKNTLELKIDPASETGFTNTVSALSLAQEELSSYRHNPNARRVLVLLTDGLPTEAGDGDIIRKTESMAKQINDSGVEVYSIGLGKNVDQQFIKNISSKTENAYFAPTGEELEGIYNEITSTLCEVGPTKIDVVAKIKANFAPLRQ